jgi:hypothetical protein
MSRQKAPTLLLGFMCRAAGMAAMCTGVARFTFSQCRTEHNQPPNQPLLSAAASAVNLRCVICPADAAQPLLLPDPAADKAGFQAAVRQQLRLLLDAWLATLRERGIRLLLLALGELAPPQPSHVVHVEYVEAQH